MVRTNETFVRRRQFIQYGLAGTAVAGAAGLIPGFLKRRVQAQGATEFDLSIEEVFVPIFPRKPPIYMWAFKSLAPTGPTYTAQDLVDAKDLPAVPGPVLVVREGTEVTLTIHNNNTRTDDHAFAVSRQPVPASPDVLPEPLAEHGLIQMEGPERVRPGQSGTYRITVHSAGTYLYFAPLNNPVNRIMGLHGALVVLPTTGTTPYTAPPPAIRALFDDLTASPRFARPGLDGELDPQTPGDAWEMLNPKRNFIWLFNQIDDVHVNNVLRAGQIVSPGFVSQVRETFLPRYFTINGKVGFASVHATETAPHGHIGEPVLIRSLNAGLMTHSPHIHGNHVFELTNQLPPNTPFFDVADNVIELDTWELGPLVIKDVLLAYRKPPDIFPWPPSQEQFGLEGMRYPMHCHTEVSQTAAGGNYPQGAIADWVLLGPHQH